MVMDRAAVGAAAAPHRLTDDRNDLVVTFRAAKVIKLILTLNLRRRYD
jgi:hypothetical protein